jgi:signal peptidase II
LKTLNKWTLLAVISVTWLAADQWTKYLAVERLTYAFQQAGATTLPEKLHAFVTVKNPTPSRPYLVASWWQNRYTQNPGAAWSFLAGTNEKFRVPFFHLVSIAAIIFILSYYRKLKAEQRYTQLALSLVFGGALGNALDRVLRGYVIDFIDWNWFDPNWLKPSLHWPLFNVADSGISVGLVLLFLEMLIQKKPGHKPAASNVRT